MIAFDRFPFSDFEPDTFASEVRLQVFAGLQTCENVLDAFAEVNELI